MKIESVILSSDSNPEYIDFWPMVSRQWHKTGIKPVLCYLRAANDTRRISREYGEVIDYDLVEEIPASLQGQIARIFHASTCGEDVVMINDIDMLPVPIPENANCSLYQQWVENVDSGKYVHAGMGFDNYKRYSMWHHIARGSVFKKVLDICGTWKEFASFIFELSCNEDWVKQTQMLGIRVNNLPWVLDEAWSTRKMMEYSDQNIFHHAPITAESIITRTAWGYDADLLRQGH